MVTKIIYAKSDCDDRRRNAALTKFIKFVLSLTNVLPPIAVFAVALARIHWTSTNL